ncbi:interleukin-2 receptor subunit beta-like [Megalops cyprinoides]|uniref:interleukin-2 receptor subunit beta-like n=1 Tax=Megalops cyprinoides TaxID=118141 RepID=UPI001863DC63|nr:interleukin-2 receptor subunit beta-like [Megalops cyprinoides]
MREAVMESMWPMCLLLLLSVQPQPSCSFQGLTCVNDYINKTTCYWSNSGIGPEVDCGLCGRTRISKEKIILSSCDLKPMEHHHHTVRSCQLVFATVFSSLHRLTITLKCENSTVAVLEDYRPARNIKMNAPGRPIISKYNISWSLGTPQSRYIMKYSFQMQYKKSAQLWQNAVSRNISNRQMSVELNEDMLEKGQWYEARVRIKPDEGTGLKGEWSSWSPVASWRSEVGRSPAQDTIPPGIVQGSVLGLIVGPVAAVAVLLLLITCKWHGTSWFYKLQFPHVPNPSTFFDALNTIHGGNFQKWLSPMFDPESFEVPQCFDDISPVEVSKAKDVTALLYKEHSRSPAEHWDSSAGSSCFSNMGYFYSKYPGSYEIDACPVYFSYQAEEGCAEEEGGGEGVILDDGPLQTSSSYECLEQLGELHGEPQHPDPGCRVGNEDQESCEEEKAEDGPKEMGDSSPPAIVLPLSLPGQMPFSSSLFPHHLPGFPQPPLAFQGFDSGTAAGSSDTSCPLEGRSSSVTFAPSSGGYVSVKDMQDTYCNKSI